MARFLRPNVRNCISTQLRMASDHQMGDLGGGAGKGEGGGTMAKKQVKREYTQEEMYFRRKEQEQLANLKQHHREEIDHHKKEIERLQREIDRHKGKIRKLKHDD